MVIGSIIKYDSSKNFDENLTICDNKIKIKIQRRPSCQYMNYNRFECSICMYKNKSCNKCDYENKVFYKKN